MSMSLTGVPQSYLAGAIAPVDEEITAWSLTVTGTIPPELDGLYLRNGPNPAPVDFDGPYHWFLPDGMLHGVRLHNGEALWYRNRWVRTDVLADKLGTPKSAGPDDVAFIPNTSNTSVFCHAGHILTVAEWGLPYEVDSELATLGRYDFGGRLRAQMTAHPKIDPGTGKMYFTSFGPVPPYLLFHVADSDGTLVKTEVIDVAGPSLMHDWAMTQNHVLFLDLSVTFDADLAQTAGFPYAWNDSYGARIGVMPKDGTNADVKWFDIDPCFIVHTVNAFERGNEIIRDAPWYSDELREAWSPDILGIGIGATLRRWRFNVTTGAVSTEQIDDRPFEFPQMNRELLGREYDIAYGVETIQGGPHTDFGALYKWDLRSGSRLTHTAGPGHSAAEPTFVAAADAVNEDDGWLLTYVYDPHRDSSQLVIIDATDFQAPPQAVIELPRRVPLGFHGTWIPSSKS